MLQTDTLYKSLIKAIAYAAGIIILLWFLYTISNVVLLLLFAIILTLVINAPVAWLEKKGLRRFWACLIVFGCILIVMALLGWLIIPKISDQITTLINNLPGYANQLSKNVSSWFQNYPEINADIRKQGITLSEWIPSVPHTLMRIGNYSLSIVSMVLIIIFLLAWWYMRFPVPGRCCNCIFPFFRCSSTIEPPGPLYTSTMLIGWMRANIIGGGVRATCITIFLSFMHVPGAWVWGALAFFSELIPKLGFYIMAIPPILVALSVSPSTAFWVTVFMLALDEVMGDFILPKLRSNSMNIHPVSILFILLAMASAFGVLGALLATPLTAIIKAYYETFFISRFKEDQELDRHIDAILYRSNEPKKAVPDVSPPDSPETTRQK